VILSGGDLLAYAGALGLLVVTPGPVVAAIVARAVSAGFRAAWPLAAGVFVGDLLWPLLAMLGLGAIVQVHAEALVALRWFGAGLLGWMGWRLVRGRGGVPQPGALAGGAAGRPAFLAGLLVIAGNPKAILFYLGVLPAFFAIDRFGAADIVAVCLLSGLVPFLGNLAWALLAGRARAFLRSPRAVAGVNTGAGLALIGVGAAILLS
jgi:threonine/homoserine/homoserine lactone efflux protein